MACHRTISAAQDRSAAAGKYDEFVQALKDLCEEHGVQLASRGNEPIQVWDLEPGDEPVRWPGTIDQTWPEPPAGGEFVKVRAWVVAWRT